MESGSAHCKMFQRVCSWNLLCQRNAPMLSITWAYIIEITTSNVSHFKRVCILDFACIRFYHTLHEPWSWTYTEKSRMWTLCIGWVYYKFPLLFVSCSHTAHTAESWLVFMSIALIMQCGRVSLETSSNEIFSGFFIFIHSLSSFIHTPLILFSPQPDEFHIGRNANIS